MVLLFWANGGDSSTATDMSEEQKLSRRVFLNRLVAGGMAAWAIPVLSHLRPAQRRGPSVQSVSAGKAADLAERQMKTAADNGHPVIVTAGDWRYKASIEQSVAAARKFGYEISVYDLGGLGRGIPFTIDDQSFKTNGYYEIRPDSGWKTKARFKPALIRHALENNPGRFIVWMDGDACLAHSIDEILSDDYDIGVIARKFTETWRYPNVVNHALEHHPTTEMKGEINAGVMIFCPTLAASTFVEQWKQMTDMVGNDQLALHKLINPNGEQLADMVGKRYGPFVPKILMAAGARVKTFPYEYNWRRWSRDTSYPARMHEAKILHFCGGKRLQGANA